MKIRTKFSVASGIVILIVLSLLALSTHLAINTTVEDKTRAYIEDNATLMSTGIGNWLQGKSAQINLLKSVIESDFSADNFQKGLEFAAVKNDFLLIFGTLNTETGLRSNNPNRQNPPNVDFRDKPWYKLAKNQSETVFTAPYQDAATQELLLSIVSNIEYQGQFQGVIGGDLSLNTIAETVNTINFDGTGIAFIVDEQGNIITHPTADLNGKNSNNIYQQAPTNSKQILEIEHDNLDKLLYFYPLPAAQGMNWYLGVLLEKDKVYQSLTDLTQRTALFSIISIIICIFLLRKLAKHLLTPLNHLDAAIANIAMGGGDLTQRLAIKSEDECGAVAKNFNQFLDSMQTLIIEIKNKASGVVDNSNASTQLAIQSGEQLNQQKSLIEGLATAMNEMTATSADIASSAQEAASSITSVNDETEQSRVTFTETSNYINQLSDTITDSQTVSDQLAQYSTNIEQVLSVINGIAEQTNLLALNAAIEAARAGEQGRGFAVVADEVRTLALRTQESTTEIKSTIDQIQSASASVQQAMQESKEKATVCVNHAATANSALKVISESVKEIMDRNIQIAAAIEQQSVVAEEINLNTNHINDISTTVGEFSSNQLQANSQLIDEVTQQQGLLNKFTV
ncbi:methyl-accepting chemotaxis protein [Shewanella colwelliana]|uniref:methyl-accepting chemotaxis protein n=1 Tax=Shewanella colwelliana TaxID=23 RepID=UPI003D05EFD0